MHVNDNGGCGGVGGGGGRHTLFLDSMVRVNTACDLLLSRFIEVDATRRFNQPVVNTWGEGRGGVWWFLQAQVIMEHLGNLENCTRRYSACLLVG